MKLWKKLTILLIFLVMFFSIAAQYAKYFPDIIVTDPDGIWLDARAYSSLSDAVAAIVAKADNRDLWIMSQETQSGDLTIPSYVSLKFLGDGEIYMSSGTLTVQTRSIEAQHKQIFNGGGSYDFADGTRLQNDWFPSIDYALARTSSDSVIIEVVAPQTISDDAIVGEDVTLLWKGPDRVLTLTAGKSLTVRGRIIAGDYKILDVTAGVGGVTTDGTSTFNEYSAWYGAPLTVAAGVTDTLWDLDLEDETAYYVQAKVLAQEVGGAGRAGYNIAAIVYRDGGGVATLQGGSYTTLAEVESDSGWACVFDVSGDLIRLRATGDTANVTNWTYEITRMAQDGS